MGTRTDYGKGLYDQLMDVMGRLDAVEKQHREETARLKEEILVLKRKNSTLMEENQKLKDDNIRLRNLLAHDSSNTSMPPSSDQKGGKAANTYNGREMSPPDPGDWDTENSLFYHQICTGYGSVTGHYGNKDLCRCTGKI